eukprot:6701848-Prymnesium_polylepis.1
MSSRNIIPAAVPRENNPSPNEPARGGQPTSPPPLDRLCPTTAPPTSTPRWATFLPWTPSRAPTKCIQLPRPPRPCSTTTTASHRSGRHSLPPRRLAQPAPRRTPRPGSSRRV